MNDLDPSIMSYSEIVEELALIGTRMKALWSEKHHRDEERRRDANAAMERMINELRPTFSNNGSAGFRRRI